MWSDSRSLYLQNLANLLLRLRRDLGVLKGATLELHPKATMDIKRNIDFIAFGDPTDSKILMGVPYTENPELNPGEIRLVKKYFIPNRTEKERDSVD